MRFVQAVGGAGAIVLARAVVRDIYSGARASRELSVMGAITGFRADRRADHRRRAAESLFGWRAIFVMLVIFAAVAGSAAARLLPETLHTRTPGPFSLRKCSGFTAR